MSQEERNKEVVRNAIQAFNDRDLELFFSFHTEDTTSHEVFFPEPLQRDEFREFLATFMQAYPDAHIDTQNMVAQGNTVVVENVLTATFENDLGETKATGRSYTAKEAVFFELENEKIKAARIYLDQKSVEQQLGIYPGE
jgi:steroid delta-isomerase-like uncharacterized protein